LDWSRFIAHHNNYIDIIHYALFLLNFLTAVQVLLPYAM